MLFEGLELEGEERAGVLREINRPAQLNIKGSEEKKTQPNKNNIGIL